MKKSLALLSGICLALSSGLASAVTLNGWNVGNPTPVEAAGLVNATKNVGGVAKVSNASIVPNASQVSKILRGGVAGVALTVAVNELLDGIDWVMDPANNQIKYKETSLVGGTWWCNGGEGLTSREACESYLTYLLKNHSDFYTYATITNCIKDSPIQITCHYDTNRGKYFVIAGYINGSVNLEEKNLPLDTASQKVIDNAQAGNTDAQVATVAAAQDILNEAQNDAEKAKPIVQQLEDNSTNCNSENPDPEDVNCGIEPTEHSKLRASEGRPVGKVVNDIQRARNSDIFVQTSNNRFIVRGLNSREHIVSKDAEHITTVELRTAKQHNKLLNQGDRRFATQAEVDLLKSFIK
ncbi:hypothetical protein [Acinetobacter bereziniae]|uniref:hypothetical protein n=1 Tax=Acinetobacter bereziniae TaxID=106648 RepID=UPI0032B4A4B4